MDDRGRIKLSKEIVEPGASVVIVDVPDSYFLGIPIKADPLTLSGSWVKSKATVGRLKALAEKNAAADALTRAKRRKQL